MTFLVVFSLYCNKNRINFPSTCSFYIAQHASFARSTDIPVLFIVVAPPSFLKIPSACFATIPVLVVFVATARSLKICAHDGVCLLSPSLPFHHSRQSFASGCAFRSSSVREFLFLVFFFFFSFTAHFQRYSITM